ncbi:hypothetical protein [Lentilactobacillus parabuchneri]|uniref:hypothetical protein n=1 Tax=Lentilactobacillus parabuchneri TaxID=152331 RepID=UPI002307E351|nr:hypothetical protein [Lentilactobacillus parabuchneri]MDB1104707.1 hypothetical protein [Lentilactobacillus parabuchneri]
MTIEICDSEMFDVYSKAIKNGGSLFDSVYYFVDNFSPDSETLVKEYQAVINALINRTKIKLYKATKYRVKLPGLADSFGQQYVTRLKNGDSYFACGEKKNSVVIDKLIQEFAKDEVDYIMKSVIEGIVEEVK